MYQPTRDSVPASWPEKLVDGGRILHHIDPRCDLDCDLVGGHKIQVPDTTQGFGNLPLSWYFHSVVTMFDKSKQGVNCGTEREHTSCMSF